MIYLQEMDQLKDLLPEVLMRSKGEKKKKKRKLLKPLKP